MSVIAAVRVPSTSFELGRILSVEGASTIELERLVPVGEATVPLAWIHGPTRESFVERIRQHRAVDDASRVDVFEDRILFTIAWDSTRDDFLEAIRASGGQLLSAVGGPETWHLELRFHSHDALGEFTRRCENEGTSLEVTRVSNPTATDTAQWYGMTEPQREAMTLAVREGYYDIPRGCTTQELADTLGVSDQAVIERLRRAIVSLAENCLGTAGPAE